MSGNEFNGTTAINKKSIRLTVEKFFNNHLLPLGIERYRYTGSTGKKTLSGDIDLCISCSPSNKNSLAKMLQKALGEENAKVSGQNITVKYPISGFERWSVQVDLMLADDDKVDDVAWLMSGDGDDGVKGVYRNLMLCHIAKKVSSQMSEDEKITISFPGGLQHKHLCGKKWVGKKQKITNPGEILTILGINEKAENIVTFRQLVDVMLKSPVLEGYLEDFPNYINNYIKRDPEQANRALWYIKTRTRLKNERGNS